VFLFTNQRAGLSPVFAIFINHSRLADIIKAFVFFPWNQSGKENLLNKNY